MGSILIIAYRNLLQAKRRTILLATALALVAMLMTLLMSLAGGLRNTMIRNATALVSGHVNIGGFYKSKPSEAWPMITGVDEIRKIAAEHTPDLVHMVDRDRAWAKIVSDQGSFYASPSGIDITEEKRLFDLIQLAEESEYKTGGRKMVLGDLKKLAEPHTAMIFADQAKRLKVQIGDMVTISAPTGSGRVNTIDVTIVAIARDFGFMSNWNIFIPKKDVRILYQIVEDSSSVVMLYLKDPEKAQEVMGRLRGVFEKKGYVLMDHEPNPFFMKFETVSGEDWTGQKLDLTIWSDEVSYVKWVVTALDGLSYLLVGILMVIIAVGIMNSMWISVRERTREVGTIRAIGMGRLKVLGLFLGEALMLGLFATSLGSALGVCVCEIVDTASWRIPYDAVRALLMSQVLHLSISFWQVVKIVVTFTCIVGLSACWPAFKASRMQPVTAIHHAG